MKTITINQLQAYSGIKAHTIRIWEKRYNLLQPQRNNGNIRGYSLTQTNSFLDLVLLNKNGYKISRLVDMTAEEVEQKKLLLTDAESLAEKALKDILMAYLAEEVEKLEELITYCIKTQDPRHIIRCVLLPFANCIDILWKEHRRFSAIEKVVFKLVERKVTYLIEKSDFKQNRRETVILAGMPSEQNGLPLLFAHYFLAEAGSHCLQLKETSSKDLSKLIDQFQPSQILTYHTRKKNETVISEWKKVVANGAIQPELYVLAERAGKEMTNSQRPLLISLEDLAEGQIEANLIDKIPSVLISDNWLG